jgi:drug/metabolite transporter (DMT)-like permease
MGVGGLLNLAIPISLSTIAQQWVPSAFVQITKPLVPAVTQMGSHFCFKDERFTRLKSHALLASLVGVALTAVPSFLHANATNTTQLLSVGFVLLIASVTVLV